ncbi:MAG TPA: FecR domain-containing protein [Parasegetibacter sp.]
METPEQIAQLLYKLAQGTLTAEDEVLLQRWISASPHNKNLAGSLDDDFRLMEDIHLLRPENWNLLEERMYQKISAHCRAQTPAPVIPVYRRWFVAASVVLLVVVGTYLWYQKNNESIPNNTSQQILTDIAPGRQGAILTLADGTQIDLDSAGTRVIVNENGVQAMLKEGQLIYDGVGSGSITYHTTTTPNGRQFEMALPDGTRIWLNAGSSITYPTAFVGNTRTVSLTGEAYFEVSKNKEKPFIVIIADRAKVEVLGTHFNVNAYANELSINTTLLEGAVKVSRLLTTGSDLSVQLKPGQQAQVGDEVRVVNDADIEKVMAWKNGLFNFNGLNFSEIMRQLERWYDIRVEYENNKVPDIPIAGEMTRGVTLNALLTQLGEMGVRYKLNERTLLILE